MAAQSNEARFYLPETLAEALTIKAKYGDKARFVAGGTDLLLQARAGRHQPEAFIRLPHMDVEPCVTGEQLELNALTPLRRLEQHTLVRQHAPLLASGMGQIGSPQIRSAGTLGGNLGNASPAADSAPPLLVYEAIVQVASATGEREIPITDFFVGPGRTALLPDEAIVTVRVPVATPDEFSFFRKFGPRGANVISAASFAARIGMADGKVTVARLAAGSVAPRPTRLPHTEAALLGETVADLADEAAVDRLLAALDQDISPIDDVRGSHWYKGEVIARCVRLLAEELAGQSAA